MPCLHWIREKTKIENMEEMDWRKKGQRKKKDRIKSHWERINWPLMEILGIRKKT